MVYMDTNFLSFKVPSIIVVFFSYLTRVSMSGSTLESKSRRLHHKDFSVATPAEYVQKFGGTNVINKVSQLI